MHEVKLEYVGSAGVDAGLLTISDPCYFVSAFNGGDESWRDFCAKLDIDYMEHGQYYGEPLGKGNGVTFRTTHGDGSYPVYMLFDKWRRARIAVVDMDGVLEDPNEDRAWYERGEQRTAELVIGDPQPKVYQIMYGRVGESGGRGQIIRTYFSHAKCEEFLDKNNYIKVNDAERPLWFSPHDKDRAEHYKKDRERAFALIASIGEKTRKGISLSQEEQTAAYSWDKANAYLADYYFIQAVVIGDENESVDQWS